MVVPCNTFGSLMRSWFPSLCCGTSSVLTISLIRWQCLRTCLDHWWDLGFLAYAMALLLSQYKGMESTMEGTTLSSVMNFFIQTTCFSAFEAAMYSSSIIEYAVVSCLELFYLTTPLLRVNTKWDWDLLSSLLDWKLAFVNTCTSEEWLP